MREPAEPLTESAEIELEDKLEELVTRSGMAAQLERAPSGDILKIRDPAGRLLIEIRDDSHTVVIGVAEGDLELRADKGRVKIAGAEGVEIAGKSVSVRAEHLRQAIGVLETRAKRVIEKAGDVYREVEGLSQLRAADVRIVATETFRALAERFRLRTKKDVKIDGEKIYLG